MIFGRYILQWDEINRDTPVPGMREQCRNQVRLEKTSTFIIFISQLKKLPIIYNVKNRYDSTL